LRSILEQAAAAKDRDPVNQKIGDYYAACMDEAAVNQRGVAAIKPQLDLIAGVKSTRDLAQVVARLQLEDVRGELMFGPGSIQDPDNSEQQIANLDQGGLGLPDRDYYTKDDAKSKEIRDRYVQHVQKMFSLIGDTPELARLHADTILRMEMALANASQTRTERRDPYKLKHKMPPAELARLVPNFDWGVYWKTLKPPAFQTVNVMAPDFFKQLSASLTSEPLEAWKQYLRFHIANLYAGYLSDDFSNERF
jgi:endothelin-converting enzyme/putative endopeptidase